MNPDIQKLYEIKLLWKIQEIKNDKNIICMPWQGSWIRVHAFAQMGIVRQDMADGKGITTVSTTKAHRHN